MRKAYIVLVLLVSLVLLNGCVLEGIWRRLPTEFRGVVANESSYTLEIWIYDTDANKLIFTTTLAPDHYTITHWMREITHSAPRELSQISTTGPHTFIPTQSKQIALTMVSTTIGG